MFRYHLLGHFLAELIEICCGPLLNSILKSTEGNFLKHYEYFFSPKKSCQNCWCYSHTKMIKNVIFNKTKNTSLCFLIYMSSGCVQLFTAFEVVVLKLYVPW